jgi:hypothetical protein
MPASVSVTCIATLRKRTPGAPLARDILPIRVVPSVGAAPSGSTACRPKQVSRSQIQEDLSSDGVESIRKCEQSPITICGFTGSDGNRRHSGVTAISDLIAICDRLSSRRI